MSNIILQPSTKLFLKDPQSSELGKNIVLHSIELISKLGFEDFTFKKLSVVINSTEASIYRYFENKHRVLVYLIAWYWEWLDYKIRFETHFIDKPEVKLDRIIKILAEQKCPDETFPDINELALNKIVISESDKTYLTKHVDADNKEGVFKGYESLCKEIAQIIEQINPDFQFAKALISTLLEAAHQQLFFSQHLPSLTEISHFDDPYDANYRFLKTMIFNTIES
ncbi:MAG: TetR/AcrR family transcriptional regulator [Marinoscillum sp.]